MRFLSEALEAVQYKATFLFSMIPLGSLFQSLNSVSCYPWDIRFLHYLVSGSGKAMPINRPLAFRKGSLT
eukprot:1158316-Pelagomonas_calceolata.AAC.1